MKDLRQVFFILKKRELSYNVKYAKEDVMQDPIGDEQTVPLSNAPAQKPRYTFFANTGKKVGIVATRTYFRLKQFLNQEIPLPSAKNLFSHRNTPQTHSNLPSKPIENTEKNSATKDPEPESGENLRNLATRSHEILASITTVFPFTLFPDTLLLDRTKITIIKRNFFFSSEVMSIRIDDILNVTSGIGPFFGSITIASRVLSSEDHFTINYFWRHDAVEMKHLIQGYVIAQHNGIDTKHLEKKELLATLSELGHDSRS